MVHQFYKELKIAYSKGKPIRKLIPQIFTYLKENRFKGNRLETGIPWLTKSAVCFLDGFVKEGMKVFEYGSGASTIYFTKKDVILYSVEHDRKWYVNVIAKVPEVNSKINLILREPLLIESNLLKSSVLSNKDNRFINHDYRDYSEAILDHPDSFFDLILIDGRVRLECLKNSLPKLKVDGLLVFDNSDRYELIENLDSNQFKTILNTYDLVESDLFFAETSILKKLF